MYVFCTTTAVRIKTNKYKNEKKSYFKMHKKFDANKKATIKFKAYQNRGTGK